MNTKLLMDWVEALEGLGKTNWRKAGFDMTVWVKNRLPETPLLGCGTVCCAYGVGAALPSWKEAGLGFEEYAGRYRYADKPWITLGITHDQFQSITYAALYTVKEDFITPHMVAAKIKKILSCDGI